jgi:hypothetical protein
MSNNKQSSVELFAIALYERGYLQGNGDEINDLLLHLKSMHKEEIENVWKESRLTHPMIGFKHETFEQYYNETFGGDNEQQ